MTQDYRVLLYYQYELMELFLVLSSKQMPTWN